MGFDFGIPGRSTRELNKFPKPGFIAEAVFWYEANKNNLTINSNNKVTELLDKSGNGHKMSINSGGVPSYSNSMLNGYPGISCDQNTGLPYTEDNTGGIVLDSTKNGFAVVFVMSYKNPNDSDTNRYFGVDSTQQVIAYFNGTQGDETEGKHGFKSDEQQTLSSLVKYSRVTIPYVLTLGVYDDGTGFMRFNGTDIITGQTYGDYAYWSNDLYSIVWGGVEVGTDPQDRWRGGLGTAIAFNRKLSDGEHKDLEKWLLDKYEIQT